MLPITRKSYESPWDMLRDMDRVFNRTLSTEDGGYTAAYPVDIHEDTDKLVVEAELPGFNRDEIEINLEQGVLSIDASRAVQKKEGDVHLNERRYTRVSRRFSLPTSIDESRVQANLDNGILTLTLPKREEVKPRKITIG